MRNITFLIITAALSLGSIAYMINKSPVNMKTGVIAVEKGQHAGKTALILREENIIRSALLFRTAAAVIPGFSVKTGRYRIVPGMTTFDVALLLHSGRVIRRKVTIPEGFNLYEIGSRLEKNQVVKARDFLRKARDRNFLKNTGINSATAEGYLFPDTYSFREGSDAEAVIKIMHRRFLSVLDSLYKESVKTGLNRSEVVKMASLIEEEARVSSERVYVSSVFHNRIRRGMRLDCDPTVRYAVKRFTGRIRRSDLESDSPYNTYRRRGLPPTPISCPGRDSLHAALNPISTEFLFFVARNDGSHYFSRTLSEHNRAVQKYMKGVKNGFIDRQRLY